jgi:DNA invertase Pin-like site-specific DNA recombinase
MWNMDAHCISIYHWHIDRLTLIWHVTNHRTNKRWNVPVAKVVTYYRCSTSRQGRSGLGLDAQRAAVLTYAKGRHEIIAEYVEVESGKNNNRPELAAALHRAKVTGAILCIAKLDRLSRDAAFLLTLRDSGVRFIAADMPDANDMTVGIMAVVASEERKAIAARTREALAAAKARGRVLGHRSTLVAGAGQIRATARTREIAASTARDLMVVIEDIQASGITTLKGIARELQSRRIQTPRGGTTWQGVQVRRIMDRAA